ncbi:MAG: hypothetical protein F6K47_15250 [Symploca sp. SIO2E6]|nr:hypothetical protein [Symploca sp. SIO2E6]
MEGNTIPDINKEELKEESLKATKNLYEKLISDLEEFEKQNHFWSTIWFAIYVFIGLSAVLSSSISAILTFLDLSDSTLLFSVAFSSTASAYILTFLDPSSRASRRKTASRRSASLLIKAKKDEAYVSVIAASDAYKKISNLYDQFANLLQDTSEQ